MALRTAKADNVLGLHGHRKSAGPSPIRLIAHHNVGLWDINHRFMTVTMIGYISFCVPIPTTVQYNSEIVKRQKGGMQQETSSCTFSLCETSSED